MSFLTLLALALALAMDAFAVAIATGLRLQCVTLEQTGRMSSVFGAFQALMPILGWFLGRSVQSYIVDYDHWVAFVLLTFVAVRMLKEVWDNRGKTKDAACISTDDPTCGGNIFLLGFATSIDALAVGLSMALLGESIWFPALVIGIVCFIITAIGMHLGRLLCSIGSLGDKANVLGALVLIGIGVGILHDHGVF